MPFDPWAVDSGYINTGVRTSVPKPDPLAFFFIEIEWAERDNL